MSPNRDPADSRRPLLELRGVTKVYGQGRAAFPALRGIDVTVQEGEFVAIMGPSGSGKSTVMNILGCLDTPTTGSYLFRDTRVELLSRRQRALLRRHYLGFVFQGFNLLARTSAIENVELPLLYRGEPSRQRRFAARAIPILSPTKNINLSSGQRMPPVNNQQSESCDNQHIEVPSADRRCATPVAFGLGSDLLRRINDSE